PLLSRTLLSASLPLLRLLPLSTLFPYTTLFRSRLDIRKGLLSLAVAHPFALVIDAEEIERGAFEGKLGVFVAQQFHARLRVEMRDRKSTRLNSSHQIISYAVFCLKKKKMSSHSI